MMKILNKIFLFSLVCVGLSHLSTQSFFYGDDPGANAFGGAATGALIGGAAGGGRGAAIGAGVGAGMGLMSAAAARDRRRYDDDYYYDRREERRRPRSYRRKQRNLEDENAELRQRLQQYENQE